MDVSLTGSDVLVLLISVFHFHPQVSMLEYDYDILLRWKGSEKKVMRSTVQSSLITCSKEHGHYNS